MTNEHLISGLKHFFKHCFHDLRPHVLEVDASSKGSLPHGFHPGWVLETSVPCPNLHRMLFKTVVMLSIKWPYRYFITESQFKESSHHPLIRVYAGLSEQEWRYDGHHFWLPLSDLTPRSGLGYPLFFHCDGELSSEMLKWMKCYKVSRTRVQRRLPRVRTDSVSFPRTTLRELFSQKSPSQRSSCS